MIDAHAHLDFDVLRDDLTGVLQRARASHVHAILCAGYSPRHITRQLEVCKCSRGPGFSRVWAAPGLHPWVVADLKDTESLDDALAMLEEAIAEAMRGGDAPLLYGVGECGLDYYRVDRADDEARSLQERAFLSQLSLAEAHHLPAIIHAVRAHEDVLQILRENAPARGVQLHGYSGPAELIEPLAQVGATFSFGTPLTWSGQKKIKAALRRVVDLDEALWMLETDAPDRPTSEARARDEHGQPCHLEEVARAAAQILGWSVERVQEVSQRNTARFFRLPDELLQRSAAAC